MPRPVRLRPQPINQCRLAQPNTALHLTALPGRFYHLGTATSLSRSIHFALCKAAGERYPLGRMWLVDSFCVGAIRHSARLFGASGRHSGQTPMPLDLQSAHSNFTRPFLHRSVLIRGTLSRAAQHRHATDVLCRGDFTISGMGTLSRSIVFVPSCRTRLMANRWAACSL